MHWLKSLPEYQKIVSAVLFFIGLPYAVTHSVLRLRDRPILALFEEEYQQHKLAGKSQFTTHTVEELAKKFRRRQRSISNTLYRLKQQGHVYEFRTALWAYTKGPQIIGESVLPGHGLHD